MSKFHLALALFALGSLSSTGRAQCTLDELYASDALASAGFGTSLSVDGNYMAVGAPLADGVLAQTGAVYIFELVAGAWVEQAKLVAADGLSGDEFGAALDISGNRVVIGAPGTGVDPYIFQRSGATWSQTHRLSGLGPMTGAAVSLDGTVALVGAPEGAAGNGRGAAAIYEFNGSTWPRTDLIPGDLGDGFQLGFEVELQGDLAIVSAPSITAGIKGSVYVWTNFGPVWFLTQKITPIDINFGDDYGVSLSYSAQEDYLFVGAPGKAYFSWQRAGAAYVYRNQNQSFHVVTTLRPVSTQTSEELGKSIAVDGSRAAMGSPLGRVRYFEETGGTWGEVGSPTTGPQADAYSVELAMLDSTVIIASPAADGPAGETGAGKVEAQSTIGGSVSNYCIGAPNSAGPGAQMSYGGSTDIANNDFTLIVQGCPTTVPGLFFYGKAPVQVAFGDGWRCVGGSLGLFRLGPPVFTDGTGSASRLLDFTSMPVSGGSGAITAGSTWGFQYWFRDNAAGGAGFNLSDALSATFCP